jgi:methylsterol monooxygenase
LQSFWGASGSFWQALWDRLLDVIGEDLFTLWVYGTSIIVFAVYWILAGIYTIIDITKQPAALGRYKVQPGTNEQVDTKCLMKVAGQVLLNYFVVNIPFIYLSYPLMKWRGLPPLKELPNFSRVLIEMTMFALIQEILFYYLHRLFHSGYLYRFIHKKHHEWTAPIALTALYCHPLEQLIVNVLPLFLGVFIVGSHMATIWLWYTIVIMIVINDHSGYHLPFLRSPEFHDFHHLKFNQCYGVIGVLDRIHGTDVMFHKSKSYARHKLMLTLKPPREAFPDDSKCKTK